ncbi:MAG: right-handed parallel beta-helix repeat-containing protein [Tannerellaceae bacterium]
MKSTLYNLLTFFLLSGCMLACTDEDYSKNTGSETQEQSVKIKLSIQSEATQTRSQENILPEDKEDAIKNLQLFIFRRDGEQVLVKEYYFDQWTNKQIIEAYTGRFIYVLVANMHEEWIGITKYNDISNKLYNITSESDISTGEALAAVFNKELLIPYPPVGSDVVELKDGTEPISLKRLTSKVILNLQIDGTTAGNEPLRNRLNIKSVQMKNASKSMYIFNENAPLDEITTEVLHYPIRIFDANNSLNSIDDAFYILERKAADSRTLGTYVEIKAEYRDINSSVPTKLVTYKASFNTEPFENNNFQGLFNVSRNQKYMLNVKIMGTNEDDIRVDVEELHRGGVFVDQAATGRGTGASWEDAFPTISEAIAFATEYNKKTNTIRKIYVKEGIYQENIIITDGLNVMGGFASNLTGTNISDRLYTAKPILRPAQTKATTSPIVTFPSNLSQQTTLSYFIIADGAYEQGAGVSMQSKHAALHACRIRNNKANIGGGVYISNGKIWNCIIDNNEAVSNGAGIYITNNASDVQIQNVTIADNRWSSTPPPIIKGALFNQPSSGIFAASGANAGVHSCILYGNDGDNNVPSGVDYKFCAFATDQLLSWDQITDANIGIYPAGTTIDQPYVKPIYNPGFKEDNSYTLSESSDLLSRGYVGRNNPDWIYPDFNGNNPFDDRFPDLGAIQSTTFKKYIDLYLNERSFLPFIYSSINCFIASNYTDFTFKAGDLIWAIQPELADLYSPMQLMVSFANTGKQNKKRTGSFFQNNSQLLSIEFLQSYINFEITDQTMPFNLERTLYVMPSESESVSLELFTQQPFYYKTSSSIEENKRIFQEIRYPDSKLNKWLDAYEVSDKIGYTNKHYTLAIDATSDKNRSFEQKNLQYMYEFDVYGSKQVNPVTPFNTTDKIIQVPEWILGKNTSRSIIGLSETDYMQYFINFGKDEYGMFKTWGFDATIPTQSSPFDGKANTAYVLNQYMNNSNDKWDTSTEESYQDMHNNAFIFCASLNPSVREKLIKKNSIIQESDLTWYVPSINELKFISIFGNSSLQFQADNYYITSTFSNGNITRLNPTNFTEWSWESGVIPKGYLRCIRNTDTSLPYNSGVSVESSIDKSYIIHSDKMYSTDVVAITDISYSPSENQLASKFEIYPTMSDTDIDYNGAIKHCASLNSTGTASTWRIPTRKEQMLIYLMNDQLKGNENFEEFDTSKSYFIQQDEYEPLKKIFNFKDGNILQYFNAKAHVRCVRSIR